jgi:hypothetical protein
MVAQCCVYPRGKQRVHLVTLVGVGAVLKAAVGYALAIRGGWDLGPAAAPWLQWPYWLYFLSYIKMAVTCVKYIPQVTILGGGGGG